MCGRYTVFDDGENEELFDIIQSAGKKYGGKFKTGEIYPSDCVPVMTRGKSGMSINVLQWGFPGIDGNKLIINARSESVCEKITFRDSFALNRCIIPSTGFFEWSHDINSQKEKYLFKNTDSKMLYMAGIWKIYNNIPRFVILTTKANESVSDIHNRMPVILRRDIFKDWLTDSDLSKEIINSAMPELEKILYA